MTNLEAANALKKELAGTSRHVDVDECEDGTVDVLCHYGNRRLLLNVNGSYFTFSGIVGHDEHNRMKGKCPVGSYTFFLLEWMTA